MNGAQFDKLRGRVEEAIQRHGIGAVDSSGWQPQMQAGKMTGTSWIFYEGHIFEITAPQTYLQGDPSGPIDSDLGCFAILPGQYVEYHLLEGRGFVCFIFDPASVHGPKPKQTKPLP